MTQKLPDTALLPTLLDVNDEGRIVWRPTKRPAEVPALFADHSAVCIGPLVVHVDDVRHVLLAGGDWPEVAHEREKIHLRRGHFDQSRVRYHRELARQAVVAAPEAEVA